MYNKLQAIILAGGYAKRLWPLTFNRPKPLLPVAGRPIIEYVIEKLVNLEIVDITISTNLRFESCFREWLATTNYQLIKLNVERSHCEEDKPGALAALLEFTSNIRSDCLVIGGDNLFTANLKGMMQFHEEKLSPVVVLHDAKNLDAAKQCSTALLDRDNMIQDFEEKPLNPKTTLTGTCIYILPKRTIPRLKQYCEENLGKDQPGRFLQWLHKKEPVYGYILEGYWHDIGTPESYAEAEEYYTHLSENGPAYMNKVIYQNGIKIQ